MERFLVCAAGSFPVIWEPYPKSLLFSAVDDESGLRFM